MTDQPSLHKPLSALHYPFADTLPAPGQALQVAEGVLWLRMKLPFALDHINLWLLRDRLDGREGWTVVDTGIADDSTRASWEQIFVEALGGLPVLRVLVTHMHPDHIGLAHWLVQRWSSDAHLHEHPVRLWISGTDWNAARIASRQTTGHGGARAATFFAAHGLTDPDSQEKVRQRGNYYGSMVPQVPDEYRRLMDGQTLLIGDRRWQCIAGYGHAPEHISLFSEGGADGSPSPVMISGDMVLPRISTNVSVIDLEPEADPLPLYLQSLRRLEVLPADTLVLPSHGKPFTGLHDRLEQLQQHHVERLDDVRQACRQQPCSAAELLPILFRRKLDLHQTTFAMGEALAHLHALWHAGELKRQRQADGVWRFTA